MLLALRDAAKLRHVPVVLLGPSPAVNRLLQANGTHERFTTRTATTVSTAVDPALNHLRHRTKTGQWTPTGRDRAALTALLPRLEWADPAHLPRSAPTAERATRMQAAAAALATAALATRGELAELLAQYATALAHIENDPAQPSVTTPAVLNDAGDALRRLIAFLEVAAHP